jgi:signal transduction histidine kinase
MPGQPGRWWSRVVGRLTREDRADAALAVLMASVSTIETLAGNYDDGPMWLVVVTGLLITLPLAVRRRYPVGVFVFVLLMIVLESTLVGSNEGVGVFFGVLVSTYTLAAHRPLRPALAGLLLFVPVMAFANWRNNGNPLEDLEFIVALVGGFWGAGRVVWSRQQLVKQLEAQAAAVERGRAAEARAVAAEERARIARDLHDVVAHSLSVIVVQAEAGEALANDRSRTVDALHAIQRTGRSALADLRLLLDVLREDADPADDAQGGPLSPSPRLRDADALLAQVRAAGVDVDLTVEGEARDLPASVDLAVYRVLQEALTNIIRHVGPTRAEAKLRYGTHDLLLEVVDTGNRQKPDARTLADAGAGRGLLGMRERVGAFGGDLEAGPCGNGFLVRARIPVEAGQLGASP